MKTTHLLGLALWRGGVLLVVGYVGFFALRSVLAITDPQLEFALAVALTGVLFVFASVVVERIQDARAEDDPPE
jgi:membrane protein implicated in regulation of membrane protease activity